MTTSQSPFHVLKAQADQIAAALKAAERGETIAGEPAGKIAAARKRESFSVAVVMDDKVLKITITWTTVGEMTEVGLSEWIVNQMRGASAKVH